MIPKRIYLTEQELQDTATCERMVSCNESYGDITEEYINLKQIWHDVSEEPTGRYWRIMCQDEEGGCWVENRNNAMLLHNTWDEYVAVEIVVKWAYVIDLLPK